MNIAIWRTGHEIADTVAEAVYEGLSKDGNCTLCDSRSSERSFGDINIGYGILRGNDEIFRDSEKAGKPWFNIDRGYWKPGHYDGYYRISLRGTQQTFGLDKLEPDYARWDALGVEILPQRPKQDGYLLCCTATKPVCEFFGDNLQPLAYAGEHILIREKGTDRLLQPELDKCKEVRTFNSSVGWEALRQGIPVISDSKHSITGAYQKLVDKQIHDDLNERRKFFAIQASLQRSLTEIREGQLWPLLQKLLSL